MATAKKQPSGAFRVRVFFTDVNGIRHQKSITGATKKEAEYLGSAWKMEHANKSVNDITLRDAFSEYINARNKILSPTTLRSYTKISKRQFQGIIHAKLADITSETVQKAVNIEAASLAPKTVSCAFGLLKSVLKTYRPELNLNVKLPQKQKKDIYIPKTEEIKKILEAVKETPLELPTALAVTLGLRESEITGLTWSKIDFENNCIYIDEILVKDINNNTIRKAPKTTSSIRALSMSEHLKDLIVKEKKKSTSERVTELSNAAIYCRFSKLLKRLDIPHFRFHDLRHYNASLMLSLGIPNKYAQERMGHATDNMLKNVYQHLLDEKKLEVNNIMNASIDNILQ